MQSGLHTPLLGSTSFGSESRPECPSGKRRYPVPLKAYAHVYMYMGTPTYIYIYMYIGMSMYRFTPEAS